MDTWFNVFEVLQIAEEIEHKAAAFYLRAAERYPDPQRRNVYYNLATWRSKHRPPAIASAWISGQGRAGNRGAFGGPSGALVAQKRRGSTIRAARFVNVDFTAGFGDDIDGIGDLGQVWDSEQSKAFATTQSAVSRAAVKVPAIPAARTFGDYVHPITSSFSCHVVVVQLSIFVKVTEKL